MNRELLLQHFNRISEAPDAIPRLRRFILDLAVRGKLVEQDPNDEPAGELLKRIQAEKERLGVTQRRKDAKKGKNGGDSRCDVAALRETAFDLPVGWEWVRLGEICSKTGSGSTPKGGKDAYLKAGIPFLRSQNVYDDGLRLHDVAYISDETHKQMQGTAVLPDDLLLNITGGSIGRCAHVPKTFTIGNINQHVAILRLALVELPAFTHTTVLSPYFQNQIFSSLTGAGREGLPKNKMDEIVVPLPPLAEQHRIVAKVDELMALCDQLEIELNQRETHRDKLVVASLNRIITTTVEEAKDAARFHLNLLPRLTTKPEHIKQLRQTILNLAVRGKLVEQDPSDEPIDLALKRILEHRATLLRTKKIRQKKLDHFVSLPKQENLPESWVVERLGNLVDPENTISYGVLVPGNETPDGVPFVRAQDLTLNSHPNRPNKTIDPDIEKAYARTRLKGGEILLCVVGSIGKLGIVPPSWAGANIARAVARIAPAQEILREYLLVVLQAKPVQTYFSEATRTLAQPTLNVGLIELTPIPLPPLAEQQRIVAKVDELMALCDQLEARLTTTTANSRRLLEAVLRDALKTSKVTEG